MDVIGVILMLAALAVGVLITAAYGVIALTPPDFRIARRCFWAATITSCLIGIVWGLTTEHSPVARIAVPVMIAAVAMLGLLRALRWLTLREGQSSRAPKAAQPFPLALDRLSRLEFLQHRGDATNRIVFFARLNEHPC